MPVVSKPSAGQAEGEADEARLVIAKALAGRLQSATSVANADRNAPAIQVGGSVDRLGETVVNLSELGKMTQAEVAEMISEVRGLNQTVMQFMADLESIPDLPTMASSAGAGSARPAVAA